MLGSVIPNLESKFLLVWGLDKWRAEKEYLEMNLLNIRNIISFSLIFKLKLIVQEKVALDDYKPNLLKV